MPDEDEDERQVRIMIGRPPEDRIYSEDPQLLSLIEQNLEFLTKNSRKLGVMGSDHEKAFLKLTSFMLVHPEAVDILDGGSDEEERWKAERLKQYLKEYIEATKDVCCYCTKGRVVFDNGERVCEECGAVQPVDTIKVPTAYYRQVQNFGVWNKNQGTDPMQVFKLVKRKLFINDGILIRNPTDPRFLGDPEDLVLRDLLGYFTWLCTQAGLPPHIINNAAKILRKHHRRKQNQLLKIEKRQALALLIEMENLRMRGVSDREIATSEFFNGGGDAKPVLEDFNADIKLLEGRSLSSPSVGHSPDSMPLLKAGRLPRPSTLKT